MFVSVSMQPPPRCASLAKPAIIPKSKGRNFSSTPVWVLVCAFFFFILTAVSFFYRLLLSSFYSPEACCSCVKVFVNSFELPAMFAFNLKSNFSNPRCIKKKITHFRNKPTTLFDLLTFLL